MSPSGSGGTGLAVSLAFKRLLSTSLRCGLNDDVVQVRGREWPVWPHDNVHQMLEGCWGSMEAEEVVVSSGH